MVGQWFGPEWINQESGGHDVVTGSGARLLHLGLSDSKSDKAYDQCSSNYHLNFFHKLPSKYPL
jgi:hypothetical protein